MRIHEIANKLTSPALVYHEECGHYILLPDCQLLSLTWKRLSLEDKQNVRYNDRWSCIKVGNNVFMDDKSEAASNF